MGFQVRIAEPSDEQRWKDFVTSQSLHHHAHAWQWREIIAKTLGHTPQYLLCEEGGQEPSPVVGVLPLFLVKSLLFGKALISVPYLNGGGILSSHPEATEKLLESVTELAKENQVDYVELRHRAIFETKPPQLVERHHKVSMILKLASTVDEQFASFPAKLRSQIRKPQKNGITVSFSEGSDERQDHIDPFYQVFSEHMRDLGTPVSPRAFFSAVKKHFANDCRGLTLWYQEKPISTAITISHNGFVEVPWAATLKRYHHLSANMLLYWELIKDALLQGGTHFDFGRSSTDSSTHRFKEQWGSTPLPLYWYYLSNTSALPDINPHNPKFSFFVKCWKHLPLTVSNFVGPKLSRSLP